MQNKQIKLFIHVGLRKTATTWFQNILFKDNPDIKFLAKSFNNYPQWLINWNYLDDLAFERRKDQIKSKVISILDNKKINIISSEAFTNTGVIYSQALRIKELVPFAKIIITIRDPIATIKSHYKYDVAEGDSMLDINEYFDYKRTPLVIGKRKSIYLPDFYYKDIMDIYVKIFGKENLCIIRYEDMLENSEELFSILCLFLGKKIPFDLSKLKKFINQSPKETKIRKKRAQNIFKYINKNFPKTASKISVDDFMQDIPTNIMTADTESKLKRYFEGKTLGYY
jgi:hypothetical protein